MVRISNDSSRPGALAQSSALPPSPVQGTKEEITKAIFSFGDRYKAASQRDDPLGERRAEALRTAQDYVRTNRPDINPGLLQYVRTDALENGNFLRMGGAGREERMERLDGLADRLGSALNANVQGFEAWLDGKEQEQLSKFGGMTGADVFQAMKAAQPEPPREGEKAVNGKFVGKDGQVVGSLDQVQPVPGANPNGETVLLVNGMNEHLDQHEKDEEALAATGPNVIGLYAAPWTTSEPVVKAISDAVVDKVLKGETLHIVAHSQGALYTARGVEDAIDRLQGIYGEDGVKDRLRQFVQIETDGASLSDLPGGFMAWRSSMPDGPRYVHYLNSGDNVSKWFGWGLDDDLPWNRAGQDARFIIEDGGSHEFSDYMKSREDFETAWNTGMTEPP
jgi:hypothetical protein